MYVAFYLQSQGCGWTPSLPLLFKDCQRVYNFAKGCCYACGKLNVESYGRLLLIPMLMDCK